MQHTPLIQLLQSLLLTRCPVCVWARSAFGTWYLADGLKVPSLVMNSYIYSRYKLFSYVFGKLMWLTQTEIILIIGITWCLIWEPLVFMYLSPYLFTFISYSISRDHLLWYCTIISASVIVAKFSYLGHMQDQLQAYRLWLTTPHRFCIKWTCLFNTPCHNTKTQFHKEWTNRVSIIYMNLTI